MPIMERVLAIVNIFLEQNNKGKVESKDALYSSGLLESIEMFDLLINIERSGIRLRPLSTNSNMKLPLEDLDSVEKIVENCCVD